MYLNLVLLVTVGVACASPIEEPSKRQQISQLPAFDNTVNQIPDLSTILDKIQDSPWWPLLQQVIKLGTKPAIKLGINPSKRQQMSQLPAFDNTLNQVPDLSSILTQIQNSPWYQLLLQAFKPGTSNGGNSGSSPDTAGNTQPQSSACGDSSLNTDASHFIVGGQKANEGEFPWQCYLSSPPMGWGFFCGCSLISTNPIIALTAAHCVNDWEQYGKYPLHVTFGALKRSTVNDEINTLVADDVLWHNDYKSSTMVNDVAIIKFPNGASLPPGAKPICLPSGTPPGSVYVSGWGTDKSGGNVQDDLMYVEKTFLTRQQCYSSAYEYERSDIKRDMVCAAEPGKDSCQGDSGGPMVFKNGNKFEQMGVVSWGYGCADPKYPGVYASVPYHLTWIKNNAGL